MKNEIVWYKKSFSEISALLKYQELFETLIANNEDDEGTILKTISTSERFTVYIAIKPVNKDQYVPELKKLGAAECKNPGNHINKNI